MKICMLVSRVPWPLEKGDKLRAYHQLRYLAEKNEVHLCCLSDTAVPQEAIDHLRTITPHVYIFRLNRLLIALRLFRALFSDKPFQVHYFFQFATARKIRKLVEELHPDHIYCQLIRTAEYVKNMHGYRKTLDYMDALSSGVRRRTANASPLFRPFVREESRRLMTYEHLVFDYFDHHTIISSQDQQLIYHPGRNHIAVIPNGIDTAFFHPLVQEKKFDIVFTGNMSYPPNVECAQRLAQRILPIIHRQHPHVKLLIAGANPVRSVTSLSNDKVVVSGWMADIREAYASSRVFMAPMLSGSGLQNKLLEAMAMELPCITTALAANAMHARDHEHMLIAETDEELAQACIRLIEDREMTERLARNGRSFVHQNFNWQATVDSLLSLMKN